MPKISRIRFVNYRYNDGSRIWLDKTFKLYNGENTLFTLVNGGGKTVFIQGILQAINPNTNLGDRQWKGFFDKADQPCYILVEWMLDDHAGYATTGAVFQKDGTGIKSYSFVTQYTTPGNPLDIAHLPLTQREDKKLKFTPYKEFRLWLNKQREQYRSKGLYQALMVFDTKKEHRARLQELNINPAEWSGLMVEINKLEGGMNKVFEGCSSTESVLRNLILKEVELKLSREQALSMGESHVGLFDRSREHLKRLSQDRSRLEDQIQLKKELERFDAQVSELLLPKESQYTAFIQQRFNHLRQLTFDHQQLKQFEQDLLAEETLLKCQQAEVEEAKQQLKYEQASYRYHQTQEELENQRQQWTALQQEERELKQQLQTLQTQLITIQASQYYFQIQDLKDAIQSKEQLLENLKAEKTDLTKQIEACNGKLHYLLNQEMKVAKEEQTDLTARLEEAEAYLEELTQTSAKELQQLIEDRGKLSKVEAEVANLTQAYKDITREYPQWTAFDIEMTKVIAKLQQEQVDLQQLEADLRQQILSNKQQVDTIQTQLNEVGETASALRDQVTAAQFKLSNLQEEKHQNHQRLLDFYESTPTGVEAILGLEVDEVYDRHNHLRRMDEFIASLEAKRDTQSGRLTQLKKTLDQLQHGFHLEIPESLSQWLNDHQIPYTRGVDYLKEFYQPTDPLHHSVIPYALIINDQDAATINQLEETLTDDVFMPIITRTQLKQLTEELQETTTSSLLATGQTPSWLANFNPQWLDDGYVEQLTQETIEAIHQLDAEFISTKTQLEHIHKIRLQYSLFTATLADEQDLIQQFKDLTEEQTRVAHQEQVLKQTIQSMTEETEQLQEQINQSVEKVLKLEATLKQANQFEEILLQLDEKESRQEELEETIQQQEEKIKAIQKELKTEQTKHSDLRADLTKVTLFLNQLTSQRLEFEDFDPVETQESKTKIQQDLFGLRRQAANVSQDVVVEELSQLRETLKEKEDRLNHIKDKATTEYQLKRATFFDETEMEKRVEAAEQLVEDKKEEVQAAHTDLIALTSKGNEIKENILTEFKKDPYAQEQINPNFGERKQLIRNQTKSIKEATETNDTQQSQVKAILNALQDALNLTSSEFVETAERSLDRQPLTHPHHLNFEKLDDTLAFIKEERKQLAKELKAIEAFEEEWVRQINDLIISTKEVSVLNDLNFLLRTEQQFRKRDVQDVCKVLQTQMKKNAILLQKLEKDLEGLQRSMEEFIKDCLTHIENIYREIKLFGRNVSIRWKGEKKNLINLTIPQRSTDLELKVQTYVQSLVQTLVNYYKTDRTDEVDGYILKSINMISLLELITPVADYRLHLFKIEIIAEQSAYRRWEDLVSKASGGERFFASFVLCAALLTYSRSGQVIRDIQKIGKVLVMDNPFGVVTSDHLLKPVFELAEQLNIQMLCFTGINDINIFNHFNLIYALRIETVNSNQYAYVDYDVINKLESPQEFYLYEQVSLVD